MQLKLNEEAIYIYDLKFMTMTYNPTFLYVVTFGRNLLFQNNVVGQSLILTGLKLNKLF